jgi:hypothetical protein
MYLERIRDILVTKYGYTTQNVTSTNQVIGNGFFVLTHPRTNHLTNYLLLDVNTFEILTKETKLSLDDIAHALDFYWTEIYNSPNFISVQPIEYVNHLPFLFFLLDTNYYREIGRPIVNPKLSNETKDDIYVIQSLNYKIDIEFTNKKFMSNNIALHVEYNGNLGETLTYDMSKTINENFSKLVKPKRVFLDGSHILHEDGKIVNLSPEQIESMFNGMSDYPKLVEINDNGFCGTPYDGISKEEWYQKWKGMTEISGELLEISEKSNTLCEYLDGCIDLMYQKFMKYSNAHDANRELNAILFSIEDEWFTYRQNYFINIMINSIRKSDKYFYILNFTYEFLKEKRNKLFKKIFIEKGIYVYVDILMVLSDSINNYKGSKIYHQLEDIMRNIIIDGYNYDREYLDIMERKYDIDTKAVKELYKSMFLFGNETQKDSLIGYHRIPNSEIYRTSFKKSSGSKSNLKAILSQWEKETKQSD